MNPLVIAIITTLLTGGFIGALVAVYRAKPDRDSVIVSSAKDATEMYRGLNEGLYAELERERMRCADAQHRADAQEEWSDLLESILRDNDIDIPGTRRPHA